MGGKTQNKTKKTLIRKNFYFSPFPSFPNLNQVTIITPVLPNMQNDLKNFGLLGKVIRSLVLCNDPRNGEEISGTCDLALDHLDSGTQQERRQRLLLIFRTCPQSAGNLL